MISKTTKIYIAGHRGLVGSAFVRRLRAFAQELLCPFIALDEFLGCKTPDDDEMEAAADHFQVSPLLVKTTLVNRGRMPRYELAQG